MRRQGVERPVDIHVLLSDEEYRVLRMMADREDRNVSQMLRTLIRDRARDQGILQPHKLRSVST